MSKLTGSENKKGFFLFNMLFSGAIAGFGLALFIISCSTGVPAKSLAKAEEIPSGSTTGLYSLQDTFRAVIKKTLPSVVAVEVTQKVAARNAVSPFGQDFPWEFFFGPQQGQRSPQPSPRDQTAPNQQVEKGLGSGFVVKRDGNTVYVLTNHHVAGTADTITVTFKDEREFTAKLVGTDPRKDISLLSFETKDQDIQPLELGDSSALEVGDIVLAMGNPLGFGFSVTQGIVSALSRQNDLDGNPTGPQGNVGSYIQTDASINKGNSGGPLFNLKGEVVGINDWIASPSGGSIGLGFSIPINSAKKAINDFISQGQVKYGWLGVSIGAIDKDMAKEMNLQNKKGAFVYHVFKNSPADKGGIFPGDFILSLDGVDVKDYNDLTMRVGDLTVGEESTFDVIRNSKNLKIKVKIEQRQSEDTIDGQKNLLWPGFTVGPVTDEIRTALKVQSQVKGLVIMDVSPGGAAEIAGLKQGDILGKINGSQLNTLGDFYRLLSDSKGEIKLSFHRQGVDLSIGITR